MIVKHMISQRNQKKFFIDVVVIMVAYLTALLLVDNFAFSDALSHRILYSAPLAMCLQAVVFFFSSMYSCIWRYISMHDVVAVVKTNTIAIIVTAVGFVFFRDSLASYRAVLIIDWGLLIVGTLAARFVWRMYHEREAHSGANHNNPKPGARPTLIIGAGDAGNMLIREIKKTKNSRFDVVGVIDDDPDKMHNNLAGVPVLGTSEQLAVCIQVHAIQQVILAIPSAPKAFVRTVVARCKEAGVQIQTLPSIHELVDGTVSIAAIRDVEINDLLGRNAVEIDQHAVSRYLSGKRILVTGAAGSIGSELCRQICKFSPAKIVMLDNAETPLFHIEKEITTTFPDIHVLPVIADIRDRDRLFEVFDSYTPEVVFHAAAYKHVPMMEYNPMEAVSVNIGGTRNLVDAASRCGVENFVMISTDKAVNPTNVMGATKRAAETYVQAQSATSRTCFTTVRFGNVLGSNGSVIPIFKEQIKKGGPVTVTDERVIRYFMTIPEACQLVLQAGCLGRGGDIFVLDMGEPVKILDLAEELIRLSGFTPYEDIDIVITGLRPGEKLYEELLIDGEGIQPTQHDQICVAQAVSYPSDRVQAQIAQVLEVGKRYDTGAIIEALQLVVPEYTPTYHFDGEIPFSFKRLRPDIRINS